MVTDAFGAGGGIAQYNRDFLAALAACDKIGGITVLPRLGSRQEIRTESGLVQEVARPGRISYSLHALRSVLARPRADIVFCGHLYLAPLAAALAWLLQARLVIQLHGVEAWPTPSRLQQLACGRAALILCVSRYTRARALAWCTIAPERVVVQPNTVDDRLRPGDGQALRAQFGLRGRKVLLTLGRLHPEERYKGQDHVIRILPELVAQGVDAAYVIVGEGGDQARLERLAHELGVTDRVHFAGRVEDAAACYSATDLFVMPSTGEGFGIAYLEAMACGAPVLALNVGGSPDPLVDGLIGTLVRLEDLAAEVKIALEAPRLPPRSLLESVKRHFSREKFRLRVSQLVDRLAEEA